MLYANSTIELHASALAHNISAYKKLIGSAELGMVIKGNAYGHGIDEILLLTKDNPDIAWYFTASLSEALYVRSRGIDKPILVMGIIDEDPLLAFEHRIRIIFHQEEQFADLERALQQNLQPILHLKVDTGLGRYGFAPEQCAAVVQRLQTLAHVKLEGIFTHFAKAETPDQAYTDAQMHVFSSLLHEVKPIMPIPYIHSHATSATIFRGAEGTNLFRVGAGLYGLWPSHDVKIHAEQQGITLSQILTWKTRIMHVKNVSAGTPIGYGCSFIAPRPMRLGLLPVGYADGYQRRCSNVAKVLVADRLVPVVGRIGMNSFTVDISDLPDATVGTEVTLTGPHPGITALDIACDINSFNPREITVPILCANRKIVR